MAMMTVRNIPDEVHRAIRVQAAMHGRSAEAEVREILKTSAMPKERVKLGSMLAEIGQQLDLNDEEQTIFEQVRDKAPAKPVDFT